MFFAALSQHAAYLITARDLIIATLIKWDHEFIEKSLLGCAEERRLWLL